MLREGFLAAAMLLAVVLAGCTSSTDDTDRPLAEETAREEVALSLSFVASPATRSPGDPGEATREMPCPKYAYIFFVYNGETKAFYDENDQPYTNPADLGEPIEETYWGNLKSEGDEVYRFVLKHLKFSGGSVGGKFYAVMSAKELTSGGTPLEELGTLTEEQVLNLAVDIASPDDLPDIYATPALYNDRHDGKYVGELRTVDDVVELMLYHVAARVDIKWNVAPEIQTSHRIRTLSLVGKESQKTCKVFLPLGKTADASDETAASGFDKELKAVGDVASQWYGRKSFYFVPSLDESDICKIPLTLNGSDFPLKLNMATADKTFAPWIRADLTFSSPADFSASGMQLTIQ